MKHFLILTLVLLAGLPAHGQSFELVDRQDSFQSFSSQNIIIPLRIRNTTDKAQFYVFRKVHDDLGVSRKGYFCQDKKCLEADVDEFLKKLEPGETLDNLNFTIETGVITGNHTIRFEIFPRGIPSQAVEHVVNISIDDRPAKVRVFNSKDISIHDVYPNPTSDQATIEYSVHTDQAKAKVVIHNILGKVLGDYELPSSESRIRIGTDELPAGVYFYTVYVNNEGVLTRKLIVRK